MKAWFIFKDGNLIGNPIGYTTEKGARKSLEGCEDWHNCRKKYNHFYKNEDIPEDYKTNGMYEEMFDKSGWLLKNNVWEKKIWKPFVQENYQIVEKEFEIVFKEDDNNTSIITINEDDVDEFFTDEEKDYINILEKAFINEEIGVAVKVIGYPLKITSQNDKAYEFIYERFEYMIDGWEVEDYIWLQEQNNDKYKNMKITPYANLNIASENMFHLGKNGKLYTTVDCGDEWYEYHQITEEQFQKIRTEAVNNFMANN